MEVMLVASTPQEAYALAYEKYRDNFKLISAKQIYSTDTKKISCEITIEISQKKFLEFDTIVIDEVKPLFLDKGISRNSLDKIIFSLDKKTINNREKLATAIFQKIDSSIKIKDENIRAKRVKVFVGATGVGKTTTIAKLAFRYSSKYSVALINLDSFKVGAFEQLAHFAKTLKLEHFPIKNMLELKEIYSSLSKYDIILIDTAGISPYDTQKLIKTVEYLSIDKSKNIEVNLVISATIKYQDLQAIHETFSFLNIDTVILSKFDETRDFGTIISYLLDHSLQLSYFTTGQNVPNDITLASKEYLLEKFIGEFDS